MPLHATLDLSFLEVVEATIFALYITCKMMGYVRDIIQSHLHPRFKSLESKTCIQRMGGSIKYKVKKLLVSLGSWEDYLELVG